jgi:rhodanese-related sulfurtransferase
MAQMLRAHTNNSKKKLSGNWMKKEIVSFDNVEENLHYEGVIDIEPKELLTKKDQVILVDVRQPDEFTGELGHIPTAELMVLDTLSERINELPKDKTIVFVCRSGGRSARATAFAKSVGFKHVFNLKGGMLLWNELHLPTEM